MQDVATAPIIRCHALRGMPWAGSGLVRSAARGVPCSALLGSTAPRLMLRIGDVTHPSRPGEFDCALRIIGAAGIETFHLRGKHAEAEDDGGAFQARLAEGRGQGGAHGFDAGSIHCIALNNARDTRPGRLRHLPGIDRASPTPGAAPLATVSQPLGS